MFDEPEQAPGEKPIDPQVRAREKTDEFRMHAELCAVFEGNRKFDAEILTGLDPEIARECQKTIGRLEKAKLRDMPVISEEGWPDAEALLDMPDTKALSTNDYHIHRRPGEVMILRWLVGKQVEAFYTRLQAHFDAALNGFRQEERQANEWKQDPQMLAYLDALDAVKVKMDERYLRPIIRQHRLFILSTQTADELDITHLTDFIMGIPAAEIVGAASAPPDDPTETDRAWFFKLFVLRGMKDAQERIFFFAFLQKSDGF
jgi:hypothetical protein